MIEHILVIEDDRGKRTIILESATYSLGRGKGNSILLESSEISRHHATLLRVTKPSQSGHVFRLIDGNLQGKRSKNGIKVNGRECLSCDLQHKDEIFFGQKVRARYYAVSSSEKNEMISSYEDHEYTSFLSKSINPLTTQTDSVENSSTESALERLASFPELIAQPIIELDLAGNITYLNPYAIQIFPSIKEEKLKHPILAGLISLVKDSQQKSIIREVQFGTLFFEQFINYIDASELIRSNLVDITKRKQAEFLLQEAHNQLELRVKQRTIELTEANQKLRNEIEKKEAIATALESSIATNRALLNAIPDWMFRIDFNGVIVNFKAGKNSAPFLLKTGFIGHSLLQVLPEKIATRMIDCLQKSLNTNTSQVFEYQLEETGKEEIYEARIAVSAPNEVMVIIRDITEQKQHETSIKQALAKEKKLHEFKSRFITMTSHEFRTPLATILSSSELLENYGHKWSSDKHKLHFHRIQTAVHHMTGLLNDVLLLGKAEAGKLKFKPETIELHSFARELVAEIQLTSQTHKIIFNTKCSCLVGEIDEKLLRQILTNLISNAIKYSPESDRVNVDLFCQQDKFIFKVQDFGIGIPSDDLDCLFDSFHRGDNVGNISGTGLGLAIVKKAVELHGGSIAVESQLNIGTTFIISFPLKQKQAQNVID